MKNYFTNLKEKSGRGEKKKKASPKKQVMAALIITPHLAIIPATAIRLAKDIKSAKKHNRRKEVSIISQKQTRTTQNLEQRLLEKEKTKQKKERRYSGMSA